MSDSGVIGTGTLGNGVVVDSTTSQWITSGTACEFTWSTNVPIVAEYYVTIGNAVSPVDYTLAQMQQADWKVGSSFSVQETTGG
jgi:hypothetical protein